MSPDAMFTLFDITMEMTRLAERLDELDGDLSDDTLAEQYLLAEIAEEDKVDAYAALIRQYEVTADTRAEEAKRLQRKAKRDRERADYLKGRLKQHFEATGSKKIETKRFTVTLARHGGATPMTIHNEDVIPDEYKTIIPAKAVVDKQAVRAALEAGEDLNGGAELGERGASIRIR